MTGCTQPGCAGTIVEGYCDTCGMAPAPAAAHPPAAAPGQGHSPPSGRHAAPSGAAGPYTAPPPAGPAAPGVPPPNGAPPPPGGHWTPHGAPPGPPGLGTSGHPATAWPSAPHPAAGRSGTAWPSATGSAAPASGAVPPSGASAPSAGMPPATMPTGSAGVTGATGGSRRSSRARRGMLGMGLVEVPPVPYRDPSAVVLADPVVPEDRRFCGNPDCGKPVGRQRDGRPGRPEGFCPHCGQRFSFTPKLHPGDLVAGQYEVKGCLAHGGLGWIYLAADRNLDGRWVVMKGLLDTGDLEALAAAEAERRYLTAMDHPNIVKIFNFVNHPDPGTGTMVGYIVMEYVGGEPLQDMLRRRLRETGNREALPPAQVIAYGLEILRAFGYLHDRGMLYCDLKPANVIQVEEQLKLIDLGAVRRVDDPDSAIYGTIGYQAPEIAARGPSIPSDLYTVGRTLAVLAFPFSPASGGTAAPLPDMGSVNESFQRLLRRATDPDPGRRFLSAAEMSDQLVGVLREVRAAEEGRPHPAQSEVFGPERGAVGTDLAPATTGRAFAPLDPVEAASSLPAPLVDPLDPAAGRLAGLTAGDPDELAGMLESMPPTPETGLALIRVLSERARPVPDDLYKAVAEELPGDWRLWWYRGVAALAAGDAGTAAQFFDGMYAWLPGEAAPRLAFAFALEILGALADAERHYAAIWRTDRSYVSACFGLARIRLAAGDPQGAIRVLDEVPPTSIHRTAAQVAAVAVGVRGQAPAEPELVAAGERLGGLRLDARDRDGLASEVLESALARFATGQARAGGGTLLGVRLDEQGVRGELERVYRSLARSARSTEERHVLIGRANAVRPRTLW
ncbi:putative serine/threonine-protein kinase [Sphaerisporangium melleum]|uniref:non-specific serine/threonine protein kinase n=1 Tax=Sphaerisporangium melleum TaxID=321316 RepID=A0A917R415_9ACTN|nr:serine/threonine-protein kinase [Sphaerisporangium melleum]GGK89444.1 putative serine/threonine-protein kinase [Sphaerisporangium melleum]GII72501.1 putative serine/threonine-protein kinase [Sphaerisporangium melleum]